MINIKDLPLSDAIFSSDKKYRYALWRIWDKNLPMVNFIGLNPSIANKKENDPTLNRCISFAESWKFGGCFLTNLSAYVTTYPKELFKVENPVGVDNDKWIAEISNKTDVVVFAWGANGIFLNRNESVIKLVNKQGHCIKLTKKGHPGHPLYLKGDLNYKPYQF